MSRKLFQAVDTGRNLFTLLDQTPMWDWDFSSAVNVNSGLILRVHEQENLTIALINKQAGRRLKEVGRIRIEKVDHLLCHPSLGIDPWYFYYAVIEINCMNGISACEREQTNPKCIIEAHGHLLLSP